MTKIGGNSHVPFFLLSIFAAERVDIVVSKKFGFEPALLKTASMANSHYWHFDCGQVTLPRLLIPPTRSAMHRRV